MRWGLMFVLSGWAAFRASHVRRGVFNEDIRRVDHLRHPHGLIMSHGVALTEDRDPIS
jgi:hypothetical protein